MQNERIKIFIKKVGAKLKRNFLPLVAFALAVLVIPMTAMANSSAVLPEDSLSESQNQTAQESQPENTAEEETFQVLDIHTNEVVTIGASDYIKGVVAAEIPLTYETEAIKAQAVAAHTYALRTKAQNQSSTDASLKGADFSNDPSKYQAYLTTDSIKQMYGDQFEEYWKKLSDAVDEVIGKIAVYENEPIAAAFHSTSSGKTESAQTVWGSEVAYLQPVDSEEDKSAPQYLSEKTLPATEVEQKLKEKYPEIQLDEDKSIWFQMKESSESGTVTRVQVGNQEISGTELRTMFDLPSANFTVTYLPSEEFLFVSKGSGHGVGMSQYGANCLAKEGKNYEEILLHYYTGIQLVDRDTISI